MGERIKMNSKQQNGNENKIAVLFVANQRSYCWRWQIGEAKRLNCQIGKKLARPGMAISGGVGWLAKVE